MMRKFLLLPFFLLTVVGCEQGLQPVTGFEGTITLPTGETGEVQFPDSLNGAVAAFVKFDLSLSAETLPQKILGYSQPLNLNRPQQPYFLQAYPDEFYIVGVIATKIPINQILTLPQDSLSAHPEYFQLIGYYRNPTQPDQLGFVHFTDTKIQEGINITVDYNLTLPF